MARSTTTVEAAAAELACLSSTSSNSNYGKLSNLVVDRKIGKGQFSVVYRAHCKVDKMPLALKKVQIFEMTDAKARLDCMKEIQLLQVREGGHYQLFSLFNYDGTWKDMSAVPPNNPCGSNVPCDRRPFFRAVLKKKPVFVATGPSQCHQVLGLLHRRQRAQHCARIGRRWRFVEDDQALQEAETADP